MRARLLLLLIFCLVACRTPKPKELILTPPSPDPMPTPKAIPGFAVAFSPDATSALLLQNGALTKFSLQSEPSSEALSVSDVVDAQALALSDQLWAAAFSTGEIKVFSLGASSPPATLQHNQSPIAALAMSADSKVIVAGYNNGNIAAFDLTQKKLVLSSTEKDAHKERVTALSISPDGQTILSASSDRRVKLWGLASGSLLSTLTGHSRSTWAASLISESSAVSSSEDGSLRGWVLPGGQESFFRLGSAPILAVNQSGTRVIAMQSKIILVLDAISGVELARLVVDVPMLRAAAYHEPSRILWGFTQTGELVKWSIPEEISPEEF